MKLLIQRVKQAKVFIDRQLHSYIDRGLLVFVGFHHQDQKSFIPYLVKKMLQLRIFEDEMGKMNLSLLDTGFHLLAVSQFTLYADCQSSGKRPSFSKSMPPAEAKEFYRAFLNELATYPVNCQSGVFGASMQVELINDGPATFILEKS